MPIFLAIIICVISIVTGQLLLKKGVGTPSGKHIFLEFFKIFTTPIVILGFSIYLISAFLWLWILQRVDLSYAYPMLSLSYVFVVLFSKIFLKEHSSWIRWFGIVIICFGVFLISR